MAASGCTPETGMLVWKNLSSGNQLGKTLVGTVPGLTLVVSATGDTDATDNGIRSTGPVGATTSLLLLHSENNTNNTSQTITLTFSQRGRTCSSRCSTSTRRAAASSAGSRTTGAPWRAVHQDTSVPDGSTTGNVQLSCTMALDTVTIVYSQIGRASCRERV